jgi:signal recognition particle subunit SRP54
VFDALTSRMSRTLAGLRSRGRINPVDLESTLGEIRTALLEADVAFVVVEELVSEVRRRGLEVISLKQSGINPAQQVITIIHGEILKALGTNSRSLAEAKRPPSKIMLAGLQGSGKTTLAGKLALWLKEQGNTPLLVACDLARPNAVQQLQIIGEEIGVPVFAPEPGNGRGDPIRVASEGLAFAERRLHNYVIFDTAGRLGVDVELMKQARAIKNAIEPDDTLFVMDAMTGQDAVNTANAFNTGVGIDGVVLTKVDSDARAGAALSVTSVIGKPILFLSTGEKPKDFEPFHPDRIAQRILGMGDVATLAEQAKKALDEKSAARLEEKFVSGEEFTFEDFLEQLQAMKKMGSISKLLGMLPGAPGAQGAAMKKQIEAIDDSETDRAAAIIQSMTPLERVNPKIINGSRRLRIAKGSGHEVSTVNRLLERFSAAQKAMKQLRQTGATGRGGVGMGLPPGLMPEQMAPDMGARASRPENRPAKKSRSGNPAKRAQEERG